MKKIILIPFFLLFGCTKIDIPTPITPVEKIFTTTESKVINGQSIHFDLPSAGVYILTLIDKETGQVISREKFIGQNGENIKKIYTNSIQSKYLYLVLEDVNKNQINKTTLILN